MSEYWTEYWEELLDEVGDPPPRWLPDSNEYQAELEEALEERRLAAEEARRIYPRTGVALSLEQVKRADQLEHLRQQARLKGLPIPRRLDPEPDLPWPE
jgi:hypothetical protein